MQYIISVKQIRYTLLRWVFAGIGGVPQSETVYNSFWTSAWLLYASFTPIYVLLQCFRITSGWSLRL